MTPRLIRVQQAAAYCGMKYDMFCKLARPHLTEVPLGTGIAFDRLELDRWVDDYMARYGRRPQTKGDETWQHEEPADSSCEATPGTSKRRASGRPEAGFAAALEQVISNKQKRNSAAD